MRKKKVIQLAMMSKKTGKFKSRSGIGQRPIGIAKQRKILSLSKFWDNEKNEQV